MMKSPSSPWLPSRVPTYNVDPGAAVRTTRRQFLGVATTVGATIAFPAVRFGRAGDTPLRHIVLLMRENRSFDHYFGHFPGADGLPSDAPVTPAPVVCLGAGPPLHALRPLLLVRAQPHVLEPAVQHCGVGERVH